MRRVVLVNVAYMCWVLCVGQRSGGDDECDNDEVVQLWPAADHHTSQDGFRAKRHGGVESIWGKGAKYAVSADASAS